MKAALLIVLSLSALALAGPAVNKNNQIESQEPFNSNKQQQEQLAYTSGKDSSSTNGAKGPVVDILKQWCFSSQMSQQELTASFKKLVGAIKSSPVDQATEQAVMSERICSGAIVTKSQQSGETIGQTGTDAQAHELIKDVYMDALIACKSRDCTQQLLKIIQQQSDKVDNIRASYYMTRLAVTEKDQIKSTDEIKQLADSFVQQRDQQTSSESVERQQLFAVTSMVGKYCQDKPSDSEAKQIAQQVAKTIAERYIKPVSQQDVQQYQEQESSSSPTNSNTETSEQLVKKIAKRNAALRALANLPGHLLKEVVQVEEQIMSIAQNKQELSTSRQSAIECLEQNDKAQQMLKQLTFDQEEPIEVRVAAYRALMTVAYSADSSKNNQQKQQVASQIIDQVVKHCDDSRNQQQDDQFVLYAISHLDNMRTSQQPEHQAIKECITKNKQHYMKVQVLCKKFKQQLSDIRRSSRNYKLEQEFNQIESGLILEGDLIYESQNSQDTDNKNNVGQMLPKLIRVNMSMPVMGETVNVVEITVRQNQMDEEILSTLKLVENTKFSSQSVSKVVDSFKTSVEKQQQKNTNSNKQQQQNQNQQQQACEADLTIKVDGCTIVYLTVDDFKSSTSSSRNQHQRNTRSIYSKNSLVDDVIEYLKRSPVSFNRGINFNINERIAKVLDVEANLIAGLRFQSRAQGHSSDDFEIVAKAEPRFNFESIVGPAKMSSKKLLQRVSTKTAVGLRLRFKRDELVDVQIDLPMQSMELFTVESQIVEKSSSTKDSYTYLPESIYGQEDIYSPSIVYPTEEQIYSHQSYASNKLAKRSIFETNESMLKKIVKGKQVSYSFETSEGLARASGLRGKLRFVAVPKDMSLLVSCQVDKYEPSMQGFRVQVQKTSTGSQQQKSYVVSVSTPGSRVNRQLQLSLVQQSNSQRTIVKSDIQMSDKMSASFMTEIVHDGRQYSTKIELASRSSQWRHYIEYGVIIAAGSKSPSGRLAQVAYKPFLQLESSSLKRPVQLQGTIAYSQSPKSVISYELKCPSSGDYVQGKLIVDQRDIQSSYRMRKSPSSYRLRRSMQSPLELVLSNDLTVTNEIVAQVNSHAVKVHNMIDWNAQKIELQADFSGSYKNMRKSSSSPSSVSANVKLDTEQQVVVVERRCGQDESNNYRATVRSEWRAPSSHQMLAEVRYNGRRESLVAYKHKIDIRSVASKQYDCQMEVEVVDTERSISEKLSGRARVSTERKQKSVEVELSTKHSQVAKVQFDYESLEQHQLAVLVQTQSFAHKCELRNNKRQFAIVSRTDNQGQTYAKLVVELDKQQPGKHCKIVVEVPVERVSLAADLKLVSGQRSSLAIQTPRFVSQGEFSFETIARPLLNTNFLSSSSWLNNKSANLRLRNQIKDLQSKQAYWVDSALNGADWDKETSYLRFESPLYRTDVEFDPRDQTTKFGAFARSKRSVDSYDSLYSNKNSALDNFLASHQSVNDLAKLSLGQNKLWMLRAIMSSPFAREQLKQQARRALLQYADREQSHKHSVEWSPSDQTINCDFDYSPNTDFSSSFEPMRLKAALSPSSSRPSTMSFESDWMNADINCKPFDQEESYAKVSALSRNRRSPFKQHDSEWTYNKDKGHKAWMKHVDSEGKRHELRAESERDPKKWAKMSYDSDKYGKANWEHKWRKHVEKRSSSHHDQDQEEVFANRVAFNAQGPQHNQWKHETNFEWLEPTKMVNERRYRRSIIASSNDDDDVSAFPIGSILSRYSPAEYLKHTSARLSSSYAMSPITDKINTNEPLYKLDFDYKPQLQSARLDVQMPEDMLHSSSFEMQPTDNLYKLQSKLYNRRTQGSVYDFSATTKPNVAGLATADQEPVFVHSDHPMLERPISTKSIAYNLFKQPMKLDYSDKYGRVASFDYDQLPITNQKYSGLRQKRAAIFYKDSDNDFEHSSSYDFYPETFLGSMKPSTTGYNNKNTRTPMFSDDVAIKTQTKYGPIVVRADTSDIDNMQCELESPICNLKVSAETGANMRKLIKFHIDNKSQRVQLAKLLRKAPESIRNLKIVDKIARKVDSIRLEHDTELLVSIVDSIFKVKSQTNLNSRQVVVIDGEWNQQQGKAYAKINGERVNGQAVVDLMRKSAELVLDANVKHGEPMRHVTRLVRTSNNFYTLESTTTYKSRPIFKLVGKISSMIFEEPSHMFASRRRQASSYESHVSTFEAEIYEPKQYHIMGVFNCEKMEARVVSKCVEDNMTQETNVRFDDNTDTVVFDSRLSSANEGQVYQTRAKLNLPGLFKTDKCFYKQSSPSTCSSELIYEDKSGFWATKYQPSEYIAISTPRGKQTFKLNY